MFDSRVILISRGGILMSIGDLPEILSRRILAGIFVSRETGRAVEALVELPSPKRKLSRASVHMQEGEWGTVSPSLRLQDSM